MSIQKDEIPLCQTDEQQAVMLFSQVATALQFAPAAVRARVLLSVAAVYGVKVDLIGWVVE